VRLMVETVNELLGIGSPPINIDPARIRPSDIPIMVGDSTLFRGQTGWYPEHSFKDMLSWMIQVLEAQYK